MQEALGFTQIWELLKGGNFDLVGHNCFLDLLYMYAKFEDPLPKSWAKFASDINR